MTLDLTREKDALVKARDACELAMAECQDSWSLIDEVLRRIALLEARSELLPDAHLHIHEPITITKGDTHD